MLQNEALMFRNKSTMKKTITQLLLFLCLGLSAQENVDLSKKKEILSPEINADHSVTFRLEAKNAQKVQVQGDFLPSSGFGQGKADLAKDADGVWSFTSPKLASELYSYTFIADGIKVNDPNNAYLIRDISNIVNIFLIGGGKADFYKTTDVPHGSVTRTWYESPGLKMTRRLTLYTPPGYEKSTENYPVLYLMHGAGGDEEAWIALGRTAQIMDYLIAEKKARPMLVVMTNGNASQSAAPGESSAPMTKPVFMQPDMFSGNFEEAFPDVVKFVESTYRVKKDKASRALAGLSMGGMHTIAISANYPDLFDYLGVFSAAAFWPNESTAKAYADFDNKLKIQKEKGFKRYWIAIGKTDFLYQPNVDFRKRLDGIGFKYVYKESEGGHTWSNWRDYLTEFVPQLFQ